MHRGQGKSNINIYSIAGALAGQEAIKMISGCFAPMNGGYLFDGAHGRGFQVRLWLFVYPKTIWQQIFEFDKKISNFE